MSLQLISLSVSFKKVPLKLEVKVTKWKQILRYNITIIFQTLFFVFPVICLN